MQVCAGKSGRRKFTLADWDRDGRVDILINGRNVDFYRNLGENRFENQGPVGTRVLAGHDTCPTTVDWDHDKIPDLLVSAEDGFLYYLAQSAGSGRHDAAGSLKPTRRIKSRRIKFNSGGEYRQACACRSPE